MLWTKFVDTYCERKLWTKILKKNSEKKLWTAVNNNSEQKFLTKVVNKSWTIVLNKSCDKRLLTRISWNCSALKDFRLSFSPFKMGGWGGRVWVRKGLRSIPKHDIDLHTDIPSISLLPGLELLEMFLWGRPGKSCKRCLRTVCRKSPYFEDFLSQICCSFYRGWKKKSWGWRIKVG